jgi:PAS domain S-box-containing protein
MHPFTHWFSKLAKHSSLKPTRSLPLRRVLVVPFILQITIAMGLTGWLSIQNGERAVNDVAAKLRIEITARIQQYLRTYVETPHKINELNASALRLGELDVRDLPALEKHLWYQLETFDTVTAVYVGSKYREHIAVERGDDGQFKVKVSGDSTNHEVRIYTADKPGQRKKLLRAKSNYDPRTRPWYTSAVKSGTANWGGIYKLFATPKYVLNASLPIYDDRNNLLGVAAVDFSLTDISRFLHSLDIGRSGETFIVERRTGLLVGSSATQQPYVIQNPDAPVTKQTPVRVKATESSDRLTRHAAQHLLQRFGKLNQISNDQQFDFDIEGQRQFLQVTPLKTSQGLDWLIIVVVPESDFLDQIHANTRTTIVLCLGAFGLATVLGLLTARWITQPIFRLGAAAKAIAAGDLNQKVSVNSITELNSLALSFNQMAQQVQESFSALARTNEALEIRVAERTTELGEKNVQLQQEIQERQKAETALKASELELRLMFASMTDIVIVFDTEGRYLKCIQTQSYTYKPDVDRVGKTVYEVLPKEIADATVDAIRQASQLRNQPDYLNGNKKSIFVEYCLSVDGQETWFLASVSPLAERAVLWVARDITQLKRTQAALKQAKEAADAANLAKSQFLSNMSHELRTPLNIILGFTQLMLRQQPLHPQQLEYLDIINRSGEDLLTLINDVLEMSKIEAGRVTLNETNFDLYSLLDRLQQMFYLKARSKGLSLYFQRSPEVPQYIRADESKLRQVLVNLIGNAIKFTQTGSVTLRVSLGVRHSSFVIGETEQTTNDQPQTTIHFEVEDTGCGIASSDLNLLFEPFVQTKAGQQSLEGTGLGLPISQRFIRLMGGDVSVKSAVGEGSIFMFNIQTRVVILDEIPKPKLSRQVIGLAPGQPTYRILITEDKPENRRLLVELLTPLGFEVQEAPNGQAAIDLWQTWAPHLIWMDIRMPVMNGFEATQHIKAAGDRAPIIIALTGSAFEEDRMTALSLGFDDFVRKPMQTSIIFEKMTEHLGVRFIYQDEAGGQESQKAFSYFADRAISEPHFITMADLDRMSIAWVNQLHQAALGANTKQVLKLIEQIPASQAHLMQGLTNLVDRFCFEEIIKLTSRSVESKPLR